MRKWTKYFISRSNFTTALAIVLDCLGQLLTDERHRVGQFSPARLGRLLMCGTFKFIFVGATNFERRNAGKFAAEYKRIYCRSLKKWRRGEVEILVDNIQSIKFLQFGFFAVQSLFSDLN